MGIRFKILGILGAKPKKMKDKKAESFSLFRKSGTRYSFTKNKDKTENNVQIQRLSWSSFPMATFSVPEENSCNEDLGLGLATLRSKSSESLKKQIKNNNKHNKLSKSKSSSFFKSSSTTVKTIFSIGSSSSASVSSSCSSTASSPKGVRQSWSSGVTHILERCGNVTGSGDELSLQDYQRLSNGCLMESHFQKVQPDNFSNKYFSGCTRNGFPVPSLLEEEEEDEIMITPKIICAHKKTPDVTRKSRRQIMQELEDIKQLGMLPMELVKPKIDSTQERENLSSDFENFLYFNNDLNLKSFIGYKCLQDKNIANTNEKHETDLDINKERELIVSSSQEDFEDKDKTSVRKVSNQLYRHNGSQTSIDSDSSEFFGSNLSKSLTNSNTNTSVTVELDTSINANDRPNNLNNTEVTDPLESSGLNSIETQEHSESEDSEPMTNDEEDDVLSFENRLENDLEKLNHEETIEKEADANTLSDEEERVQLRRKPRPNLYIDINKARSVRKTLSNDRLLRRITEDGSDSTRSSRSSPRTPRSPAIDIDDVFKQRQRLIAENPKDNLTQVKDLTQRLRLPTKPPSHVEWLNGLKNKSDARQLAEAMSPVVIENAEGIFHLQEKTKEPTEEQRKRNMSKALLWIKEELNKMKEMDQQLARQLVQLQLEMQRLRLLRSCTQHEALLEEVTCEEVEQRAFMTSTDLLDLPNSQRECGFLSLRDFGVTRMNITNRRFSLR